MSEDIPESMTENPEETYTFARHHGYLAACPIFRPAPELDEHKRTKREFTFNGAETTKKPYKIKVFCISELNTHDESVLMAMLAMIGTLTRCVTVLPGNQYRSELRELGSSSTMKTTGTITNRSELLRMLGWPRTSNSYKRIEESMKRLQETRIDYEQKDALPQNSQLICINRLPDEDGSKNSVRLLVILNTLSAAVILGPSPGGVTIHHLPERRMLKTSLALGMYSQFVYLVQPGHSRPIRLSVLLKRVYAPEEKQAPSPQDGHAVDDGSGGDNAPKKRQEITPRQRDHFLTTIRKWPLPGWTLKILGRGKFARVEISRPLDPAMPTKAP